MNQMMKIQSLLDSKGFLGNDFLLWIWFQAEAKGYQYRVPDLFGTSKKVRFWVSDKVTLKSRVHHMSPEVMIRGGAPSESQEATLCLKNGKEIFSIKIGFHVEDVGDFDVQLESENLIPTGLKLPDTDQTLSWDPERSVSKRLYCIQMYIRAFDHLFERFRNVRFDQDQALKEWNEIFDWIVAKS